jgi:cytochrome c oxidase assembly factor CtaG
MDTTQRIQGGLICLGAAVAALVFLGGLWSESYWALAVPVAALVLFVLGLVFWVGWTILTVHVEPEADPSAVDPHPESRDR